MNIKDYLKDHILVFDGAMGSYFSTLHSDPLYPSEFANITSPHTITEIHNRYLTAGAKAIKTNTFSLPHNQSAPHTMEEVVQTGYALAKKAAEPFGAYVFADISTHLQTGEDDMYPWFQSVVDVFIEQGATHFLFETCANSNYLNQLGQYIKSKVPDAFLIASFAVSAQGYSKTGQFSQHLLEGVSEDFEAVGFNCVAGPNHMIGLVEKNHTTKYFSAMPNASYPTVAGNHLRYGQNATYFAEQMVEIVKSGAKIVGGCCGTTPDCIRILTEKLQHLSSKEVTTTAKPVTNSVAEEEPILKSDFFEKLKSGKKPIAVEWDSPATPEIQEYMAKAAQLQQAGVDMITIADCPVARPRIDSSLIACKLKRELGMHAMPHMTCRDRNINAAKALLMGLSVEEINNVLIITGDPIPQEQRDEIKTVYEFNSRKLIAHINTLNQSLFHSPFYLYGALNINAVNFKVQLKMAKEKIDNGCVAFFTQPVLSERGLENLKIAKEELSAPLVGGIYPPVSFRNITFLTNEISGFHVAPELSALYQDKSPEECEALAVRVCSQIAKEIAPYIDGYYLITPFKRVPLMLDILKNIPRENK